MSDIHIYLEREQPVKVITLEPTGARGPVGPAGPAGPNSVTSATTSDGTCDLSIASLTIGGTATGSIVFKNDDDYLPATIVLGGNASPQNPKSVRLYNISYNGVDYDEVLTYNGEAGDLPNYRNESPFGAIETAGNLNDTEIFITDGTEAQLAFVAYNQRLEAFEYAIATWTAQGLGGGTPLFELSEFSWQDAEMVGQLCQLGSESPYRWFVADTAGVGTTTWREIDESTVENFTVTGILTADQFLGGSATFSGALTASNISGTNTGDQDLSGLVAKSAYTPAHSILAQQSGTGSPTAVTMGNNTILGRMSGGGSNIAGLSASDARTVMGLGTLATVNGGTGVADFLTSPTSANLRAAVTDKTGTGSLVFANGNIGAATGDSLTLTKTASPNTREEIFRASVSDAPNDFIGIANGTVTGNRMAPVFFGMMNSVATNWSMGFSGYVSAANDASDSSNFGIVDFAALRSSSTTDPLNGTISNVSNRKLFTWRTGDTTYMTMTANGSLGVGTTAPSSRAILDLASTTRGFLSPRMTTAQRDAIASPPEGLEIFNTTTKKKNIYNGTAWEVVTSA